MPPECRRKPAAVQLARPRRRRTAASQQQRALIAIDRRRARDGRGSSTAIGSSPASAANGISAAIGSGSTTGSGSTNGSGSAIGSTGCSSATGAGTSIGSSTAGISAAIGSGSTTGSGSTNGSGSAIGSTGCSSATGAGTSIGSSTAGISAAIGSDSAIGSGSTNGSGSAIGSTGCFLRDRRGHFDRLLDRRHLRRHRQRLGDRFRFDKRRGLRDRFDRLLFGHRRGHFDRFLDRRHLRRHRQRLGDRFRFDERLGLRDRFDRLLLADRRGHFDRFLDRRHLRRHRQRLDDRFYDRRHLDGDRWERLGDRFWRRRNRRFFRDRLRHRNGFLDHRRLGGDRQRLRFGHGRGFGHRFGHRHRRFFDSHRLGHFDGFRFCDRLRHGNRFLDLRQLRGDRQRLGLDDGRGLGDRFGNRRCGRFLRHRRWHWRGNRLGHRGSRHHRLRHFLDVGVEIEFDLLALFLFFTRAERRTRRPQLGRVGQVQVVVFFVEPCIEIFFRDLVGHRRRHDRRQRFGLPLGLRRRRGRRWRRRGFHLGNRLADYCGRLRNRPLLRRRSHGSHRLRRDGRRARGRGRKQLLGHGVVVLHTMPSDLGPQIVPAARGHDREVLARKFRHRRQLVLNRAEFGERLLHLGRQHLVDDAADRVERQPAVGKVDLAGWRHHVRLVAGVHDQRFTVDADDCLKQGGDEAHLFTLLHTDVPAARGRARYQCRSDLTLPLVPPRGADFVDAKHLDQLVAPRLIGGDDSLGAQVLQHPFVAVVGRTDLGDACQGRF